MGSDSEPQNNWRKRKRKLQPKLQHDNKLYTLEKEKNGTRYFRCKERSTCAARLIVSIDNEYKLNRAHTCAISSTERAKDAAIERLRELTLSVEGSVKAIDLVRQVLKDVPPEVRALMPKEDSLIHRVRRWARSSNIQLVKATPEDYLIPEGEEPLFGYSGMTAGGNLPTAQEGAVATGSASSEVVKTGVVYTEPVAELGECEDRKPSGLIYLKVRVNGHYRAMIEGQTYVWKQDKTDGKVLYVCQAQIGCPVTVIVDNVQKKYELRGTHVHTIRRTDKRSRQGRYPSSLKRVDEHGNEIGVATLDDFISGKTDWQEGFNDVNQWAHNNTDSQTENVGNDTAVDDNDYTDHGGDDFQMDFDPEPEPISSQPPPAFPAKSSLQMTTTTTSNPSRRDACAKPRSKDNVKSGQRCFVCGDELIVSETLGASEETFRKACCYLNVKSEGKWYPRAENAKFYSFCESCTNEITRIHGLYKKVEEIQSLIFKKVESVEKRIADAEIVDNWMADAPHSSVLRFEGFRKQVLINYRNKLKLRREIRFGRKSGQPLIEIQPGPSAHMFAKDPSDTAAFCKIVPGSVPYPANPSDNPSNTSTEVAKDVPPPRRTRGRPKSKKAAEEIEEPITVVTAEEEPLPPPEPDNSHMDQGTLDDDGFQHDFDDSQDVASVVSEKETKFWEEDPSLLDVRRRSERQTKNNRIFNEGDDDYNDDDGGMEVNDDESDPDYHEDDDEDEDWGSAKKKRAKTSKAGKRGTQGSNVSKIGGWYSRKSGAPVGPRKIILDDKKSRKKLEPVKSKPRVTKPSHSHNIKFPDAVLTKDGRVFMEGVEIIKNPCGVYKPRPYSISYSCGACGRISTGFWKIRQHICGHHLGMYKCHICQKEFTDPRIIDRHITMTHGSAQFEDCPICTKPVKLYKNEKSMLRHRWTHLSEEEKEDPQHQSWRPPGKNPNKQAAKNTQSFMCGQCGKTFRLSTALKKHELTHMPGYEQTLMCQYCGKTFNLRKGLSQHVYSCSRKAQGHINLTTYPCPKCPTRFSTRATRSKHMRRFHMTITNADLPFTCPKCPRRFSTRVGFRTHKRVCIDGEKGNNNKRASNPQPSTSTAEFKADLGSASPSLTGDNQVHPGHSSAGSSGSQYDMAGSATALGFSYNFMGGTNYTDHQQ